MWIKCVVQAKNDDNNDIITIQKVESDKINNVSLRLVLIGSLNKNSNFNPFILDGDVVIKEGSWFKKQPSHQMIDYFHNVWFYDCVSNVIYMHNPIINI